jgi:Flp pilus assembly protein TadG
LDKTLTNNINNPQGMSPEALAAARTQATQRTATDVDQAQQAVQAKMAARGGNGLPSGVDAQVLGSIAASGANQESQMQGDITLQNEEMKRQNYWNSVSGLEGVSGQEDPNGLAGNATGAAESVGSLGKAFQDSKQSQLMGTIGGIIGGGLSGWATGGFRMPGTGA